MCDHQHPRKRKKLQPSFTTLPNHLIEEIIDHNLPPQLTSLDGNYDEYGDIILHFAIPLALTCRKLFQMVLSRISRFVPTILHRLRNNGTCIGQLVAHKQCQCISKDTCPCKYTNDECQCEHKAECDCHPKCMCKIDLYNITQIILNRRNISLQSTIKTSPSMNLKSLHFCPSFYRNKIGTYIGWIAIASECSNLKEISLPYKNLEFSADQKCVLFNVMNHLRAPIQKLRLFSSTSSVITTSGYKPKYEDTTEMYVQLFQLCSATLVDLEVSIDFDPIYKALCQVKLPALKTIRLIHDEQAKTSTKDNKNKNSSDPYYNLFISLLDNGTKLESLHLFCVSELSESRVWFYWMNCLPYVKRLFSKMYCCQSGHGKNFLEEQFRHCTTVEELGYKGTMCEMETFNNAKRKYGFSKLKKLSLDLYPCNILRFTQNVPWPSMIRKFDMSWESPLDSETIRHLGTKLPILERLVVNISKASIPAFIEFLQTQERLIDLQFAVFSGSISRFGKDWSLHYDKELNKALVSHSSKLNTLIVRGIYAKVAEGLHILRNMGENAKVFRFALASENYVIESVSMEDTSRIFDTIKRYCRNLEKLRITKRPLNGWDYPPVLEIDETEMAVKRLIKGLPLLKVSTLYNEWEWYRDVWFG